MKQQLVAQLTQYNPVLAAQGHETNSEFHAAFLLGRAVAILEGLIESPTDAIDMELARDLLADYRKWMEQER